MVIGDLPLHAKIKMGVIYGKPIVWAKKAKDHDGYPENSTTFVMHYIEKMMGFDAMEPQNSDSGRRTSGNNRHTLSNRRQWLGKAGLPWYEPQHAADAPPITFSQGIGGYDDFPGFLSCFTEAELAIVKLTTLIANRATVDGGGQETYQDYFFDLSAAEVGLVVSEAPEGTLLAGFSDNASRIAYPTAEAANNYTRDLNINDMCPFGLRTSVSSESNRVYFVLAGGGSSTGPASYGTRGLRCACNLDSDAHVSDGPDEDGCYTLQTVIIPGTPPWITVELETEEGEGEENAA